MMRTDNITSIHGDRGRKWLENLDAPVADLAQKWNLKKLKRARKEKSIGSSSIVWMTVEYRQYLAFLEDVGPLTIENIAKVIIEYFRNFAESASCSE
jgi:hypothetical protein